MGWAHKFLAKIVGELSLALLPGRDPPTRAQFIAWADMLDRISAYFRKEAGDGR